MVFIIISWQEARLSCDGKEQELSSISIVPSKLLVKLFRFLRSLFSFLTEGCMLPAALSDEGKQVVKAQSLYLQVTGIKYQLPRMLFTFSWLTLPDRENF